MLIIFGHRNERRRLRRDDGETEEWGERGEEEEDDKHELVAECFSLSLPMLSKHQNTDLRSGLEIFPLCWPRLGSEIIIEIWRDGNNDRFVRVLYDGETVDSLKWTPFYEFLDLLRRQVPDHIVERCAEASLSVQVPGKVKGAEWPQDPFTFQY
ncbi:hypothetical protein EDB85DRAFT_1890216 [Lactarius pseudohatsudake]|nr:hypothetical protein EDB85DRAFT_1890216 [Lactarius pseudohatsudake]